MSSVRGKDGAEVLAGCGNMKFIPCNTGAEVAVSLGVIESITGAIVVHMGRDFIRASLRSEAEQHQLVGIPAF